MIIFIKVIPILIAIALAGCSVFSDKPKPVSLYELEYVVSNQEMILQHYINSAQQQLLSLEKVTQGHCLNGQLAIANTLFERAQKEYQYALYKDAFITLTHFDRQLRKTHCILAYVEGKFGCKHTNKSSVLKLWYQEGRYEQCVSSVNNQTKVLSHIASENEIIIETLHEFNRPEIKPIYFESLDKVAALVLMYPKSSIVVTGHTDSIGSEHYNVKLGEKRAEKVSQYLNHKGVARTKIQIKSNGEAILREKEVSDVARVFNRHTIVTINLNTLISASSQGVDHD